MKRIGLVGEDANDTEAIHHLLAQRFKKGVHFKPILRRKKGCHLDNHATLKALAVELARETFHTIIFIRDLDGPESDLTRKKERLAWFNGLNNIAGKKGILLLNIYELEALILADIEIFNKEYKTNITHVGNVMFREDPKRFLKQKSYHSVKCYSEKHCPDLFRKLRYEVVTANCEYFRQFSAQLGQRLKGQ